MSGGCPVHHHGTSKALGCSHAGFGSFGRLFPEGAGADGNCVEAPPRLNPSDELLEILGGPGRLMDDEDHGSPDSPVPAGYTFFAQFVDHDVTLDTGSVLNRIGQCPSAIRNQRTASLDLDCVYGLGPEATPHLYDSSRAGFLATGAGGGRPWDLARADGGAALIGDPRNDENIFVSQMQLLWIRFHNRLMLSSLGSGATAEERFEHVQESVRHHYQSIVLDDFLWRVCHRETFTFARDRMTQAVSARRTAMSKGKETPHGLPSLFPLVFRHLDDRHQVPMPIEFSVAAFRFGHTTVRTAYPANENLLDIELFDERFGTLGFSGLPEELAVDWRFQLELDPSIDPVRMKSFDQLFTPEIMRLPDPVVGRTSDANRSLAFRNLVRGRSLGLPSGEALAASMRDGIGGDGYDTIEVLPLDKIFDESAFPGKASEASRARDLCATASSDGTPGTPLFFYLMREAAITTGGERLGPLGSAILLEVFGRMLVSCTTSFLYRDGAGGGFPDPRVVAGRAAGSIGTDRPSLELADIARFAGGR